jgi:signal transduction histidine kinase
MQFFRSVLFRIVLGYVALLLATVTTVSCLFYVNTAGLLSRQTDRQINMASRHLIGDYELHGEPGLITEISRLLNDDQDIASEEYLLLNTRGEKLAGNIVSWQNLNLTTRQLSEAPVERQNGYQESRIFVHRLPDDNVLVVGRTLQDVNNLRGIVSRSIYIGFLFAAILTLAGSYLFKRYLQRQLRAIHNVTVNVSEGNLRKRVEFKAGKDEFATIASEINAMLDKIETLMNATRGASNAIAHDLRTPLGRIRATLESALMREDPADPLRGEIEYALTEIDKLLGVFEKILQISEAEAGIRRRSFEPLDLAAVAGEICEFYEPVIEAEGSHLQFQASAQPFIQGDRELLAVVLANLLENALKYAGKPCKIIVTVSSAEGKANLSVADSGPGIPEAALEKITEWFFRCDTSRHLPGNGLGLSIVASYVALHEGTLDFHNTHPGLRVQIRIPEA